MIHEIIKVNVNYEKAGLSSDGCEATLTSYCYDLKDEIGRKKRPAVIICPGGGYDFCSEREAEPVALRFMGSGINAFVLRYSCVNKRFPTATLELASAVKYVRDNAHRLDIDTDKIIVGGFSAGGHLAGSLSVFWDKEFIYKPLECLPEDIKPNGSLLCYPVITSDEFSHEGSILNLVGEEQNADLKRLMSIDKQVSALTPPTFIWHCSDDDCVPIENSLSYMLALSKNNIPYECHIYDKGGHGISLCDNNSANCQEHIQPVAAKWVNNAIGWVLRF